jgi:hypothetical protein
MLKAPVLLEITPSPRAREGAGEVIPSCEMLDLVIPAQAGIRFEYAVRRIRHKK